MTSGEFANYAVHKCGCKIKFTDVNVIMIINPQTGGKFNVYPGDKDLPKEIIYKGCMRLNIPLP